jgi:ribosome-associated protein
LTIKKRPEGDKKKKTTTKRTPRTPGAPARKAPAKKSASKPLIHASHSDAKRPAARRPRPTSGDGPALRARSGPASRKTPLTGPKRPAGKRPVVAPTTPEASSAARELALALAGAGIDKKAVGIEILDVTGKVDYADFLVVMTGRSDRHVASIATGIEDAMRKRKLAPLSMEGLSGASWVLIDFGDVVVHVFQEDARAIYDIEGLWIDAGRVPVPDADKVEGGGAKEPGAD